MRRTAAALLAAFALSSVPSRAQDSGGCASFKWSVERERAAFGAGGLDTVAPGKPLPGIMRPVSVALSPTAELRFAQPPHRKPAAGTFGAVLEMPPLATAGTYQVTLSDEAWIDVLQDGREVRSSAFSGQKGCAEVRKSVRFPLKTGSAIVQISGAKADSIKVDILPGE